MKMPTETTEEKKHISGSHAEDYSDPIEWIYEQKILNEKGEPIEFENHPYLEDIFLDQSPRLTIMKAAQVGLTTLSMLKNHYDAKRHKMDIIYTLPTDNDVRIMVAGKLNRILKNHQGLVEDVADKDSVESKRVGDSMIYFRGTWTKKAAMMVTSDRLVHDEKDTSKLDIIADYQARLQHSKFKQTHTFSHPSLPETGVHADWLKSDQKHWMIKCKWCKHWQTITWDIDDPKNMSIDLNRVIFQCKKCHEEITDSMRANGQWVAWKPENTEWSGYWVPWLICPWVTAYDVVKKFRDPETTQEFWYTKVLGLPYSDAQSKLLREHFFQNLTGKSWAPGEDERVILGIDTGLRLDYVLGNNKGLFMHGDCNDYDTLDAYMRRWPRCIAIIDQGGDLIGSRKFYERWPGRVVLCALTGEQKGKELVKWGKGDEFGSATADRNRMIQLVVGEFRDKRIPVHGNENDWFEYWSDWNHLSRIKVLDPDTNQVKAYKWVRSGRDHRALATIFWRVGMRRFAGTGDIIMPDRGRKSPQSYMINPNKTVSFNPDEMFGNTRQKEELRIEDGRIVEDELKQSADEKLQEAIELSLDAIDPSGRYQ